MRGNWRSYVVALVVVSAVTAGLVSAGSASAAPPKEHPVPTANGAPVGITAGPQKAVWFTESGGNKIGRWGNLAFKEFPIPTAGSDPRGDHGRP